MAAVSKALIVGGGIGGLTAAVALRRAGVAVDLVEINPDHSVYGVGIIQPNNVLRALDRIGLARACVAQGGPFPGWRIHDREGRFLMAAPYGCDAAPDLPPAIGITRPRLQRILVDAAREAATQIRLGASVATFEDDGEGVEVVFTDGRRDRYDLIVASDGLHSQIRRQLFPDAPAPTFSGEGVWRYNFARPAEVEWGAIYYGAQVKVGLTPMSPSLMYMFVVSHEPSNPRFARQDLARLMRERLAGFSGLIGRLREEISDPDAVVYKPMEHLLLPAPWYKGRVVLIGDAAHATTPHLAQGAAMAVEDAVLLAELLCRDAPLSALLEEFMGRRYARAKYVVDCSRQIADWEIEEFTGLHNPNARPGPLLGEATRKLMEAY